MGALLERSGEALAGAQRVAVVFHCEFSSCRAPTLYRLFRQAQEHICEGHPGLVYPELYLLEGGYSEYVVQYPDDCDPRGGYTLMKDKEFASENSQCECRMRRSWGEAGGGSPWRENHVVVALREHVQAHGAAAWHSLRAAEPAAALLSPQHGEGAATASPKTPRCQIMPD